MASQREHNDERPNIIWIVPEDLGPDFACYGNPDVTTPSLDALAAQGRLYTNAFATSPVCSPSRSALVTGMYQTSIGAHHHRSHRHDGYRLPENVKLVPQRLREAGYFCAQIVDFPQEVGLKGSPKTDWNFTAPDHVWDSDAWGDLKDHQPFFAMINMGEAHRPYRGGAGPSIDPQRISSLPPYIADHPLAREDWAAYLETLQSLDAKIGTIMALLEADGLAQNTLLAFMGDHGREDFRGKASAFDAGYRVPLIIRWPGYTSTSSVRALTPGSTSDELVSLIDVSAATLAIAGLPTDDVQGRPFLLEGTPPRDYVFMARDRIDTSRDRVRMVFDGRYRYIRNFEPDQPHLIDRAYYDRTNPVRGLMRDLHAVGQLTPEQDKVFAPRRPPEELYDLWQDPYELDNLIDTSLPEVQAALASLRVALDRWIVETGDQGREPEAAQAVDIGGGPGGKKKGRKTTNENQPAVNNQAARRGKRRGDEEARPMAAEQAARPGEEQGGRESLLVPRPPASVGEPLTLAGTGILFVGGREVPLAGGKRGGAGSQTIEQAPVHYLIPNARRRSMPVVMLPGHGLSSYIYLATPDGREGWAQAFARQGYAAYVMDMPNYAVSGFDLRPFDAVRAGQLAPGALPGFMRWSNESAWRDWGIGPEPGVAFEDSKFPHAFIAQLYASFTAVAGSGAPVAQGSAAGRIGGQSAKGGAGGGDRFGSAAKVRALQALLEQIGPSILVVHSAAGAAGVALLRERPELVAALVMIEPVGSPTDTAEVEELFKEVPYLAVFGDHFELRRMQGRYEACLETARVINEAGGQAKMLHLPAQGIRGNTHLLMQDTNNRQIVEQVIDWLENGRLSMVK
jgi:N-sulfoglucosamine sulfohydrolase